MVECVFTLDYEIYGNGQGSFRDLVLDPTERLTALFEKWEARFVAFVEALELDAVETQAPDASAPLIRSQLKALRRKGFEIGLHLHPQWDRARFADGRWRLEYADYNLCALPRDRMARIVDRGLSYLRRALDEPDFTPRSFRAGNWLFQPSRIAADVLRERGIRIDSSVFKGGRQHRYGLDYRPALKNGDSWRFSDDVNVADPRGGLWEFPIHTRLVPTWKLFTPKRRSLQQKTGGPSDGGAGRLARLRDFLRWRSPLKLDFCRLSLDEMIGLVNEARRRARRSPGEPRPLIAIGHTKDLRELAPIDAFLGFLRRENIPILTFDDLLRRGLR